MPDQADVKSFDAIQAVRAALLGFGKQAEEGLVECDIEMRRFMEWLQHDRPGFWKEQVRLAHDEVQKAKQDLQRCLMYPVGVNDRPSCTEERALLKKAEAKLDYCRGKQEKLKHWIREISHEMHTYEGRTARLREVIESDTPAAAAALGRLLATLEEYAGIQSKAGSSAASTSAGTIEEPSDESVTDTTADADSPASSAEGSP
ncbi:MAG: hypothetical protein AAGF31_12040 [Planctomycetota bacterium]